MPITDCKLIDLPRVQDPRGNLTFIEQNNHVPFETKRVYFLYDVPGGSDRGAHAHKKLQQLIIAVSGSFSVDLSDGHRERRFTLNRPYVGLYLAPMIWRYLSDFSSGAVCLVLASEAYTATDYIHNHDLFLELAGKT